MSEGIARVSNGASALLSGALADLAERVHHGVARIRSGQGFGAGTVWRADGIVVTNHHVVPGGGAEVSLADGREFAGRVVARDAGNDLAVLRVEAGDLPALAVRDARTLRVGELVVAVGHPVGMVGAASVGIVTAALPDNHAPDERELIHADVLLRPGNSGGPLVDAAGRVVGVNAMVAGGLALSVPSHIVARLLAAGERPLLGVAVQAARVRAAAAVEPGETTGLLVVGLTAGGAAERAGVLIGDLLLAFDGRPLTSPEALLAALDAHRGEAARLRLLRGGAPRDLTVPLAARSQRRAA